MTKNVILKNPQIIKNILTDAELYSAEQYFRSKYKTLNFEKKLSRYIASDSMEPVLKKILNDNTNRARAIFNSATLIPTYAFFAHYEGNASLNKHKDFNACTYTLDICLYQTEPWDLYVENSPYTLHPNQALAYYGEDQIHWREDFPNPEKQQVAMIFLHYAEPEHWYFKNR